MTEPAQSHAVTAAVLTERLMQATLDYERSEGTYSRNARQNLFEARAAVEAAIDSARIIEHSKSYPVTVEALLREVLTELKFARVFVTSREKMHPCGVDLYDELTQKVEVSLGCPSDGEIYAAVSQRDMTPEEERLIQDALLKSGTLIESIPSVAQAVPDYFEVAGKLGAALVQIAGMDPKECRADDLGRAARIAREALAPALSSTDPRCTCAAIVNPNIPHARSCPLSSTEGK